MTRAAEQGFTAVKLGWGPLGQDPNHDVALAAGRAAAGATASTILIDAGPRLRRDAETAIGVARAFERLGIYWLEEPFEPDEYEATRSSPTPSTSGSRRASRTRRGGASAS